MKYGKDIKNERKPRFPFEPSFFLKIRFLKKIGNNVQDKIKNI